jgi:DNA-binding transcriptional LysR family regulator
MELRHLRYFCAVAERQSFTLAAKHLHVSQSGVSGQIRALEKELGVKLLHRNQRDVFLTAEGAVFFPEAREILAHAERATEMAVRASQGKYGTLSIGLCGPATAPFLPALIREFRQRQPGVTLGLKDINPARQPEALATGVLDIGFTRSIPPEFRKALRSEVFLRERMVVALPSGHTLAKETSIFLKQIASDPIVLYSREESPDLFDMIVGFCKRAKFSPRIADTPALWQSVLTLVEAGEGVAIVPACVQHLRSSAVTFHEVRDRGCTADVILAWRYRQPSATRDGFLSLLREKRPQIERIMRGAAA